MTADLHSGGVLAFYGAIRIELADRPGNVPVCCFRDDHDDRRASASVNADTGAWFCHACDVGGGPYHAALERGFAPADAMALVTKYGLGVKPEDHDDHDDQMRAPARTTKETKMDPLPSEEVLAGWRDRLANDQKLLARLAELRGWGRASIERLGLGFDGERVVFPIHDSDGALVSVARYRPGEGSGQRKMLAPKDRPRGLFPAPEKVGGEPIWIVEGEADVPSMLELGVQAVSIPGVSGVSKAKPARFAGRKVVVCLDADEQGRAAAIKLAAALAGAAAEVRIVNIAPERDDGYDVTDLLLEARRNGGVEDAKVALAEMEDAAEPVGTAEPARSTLTDFTQITAKPVRWLKRDRIALGKITAESGRPKIGKGLYYSHLAAAATRGDLDGDLRGEPRNVILVTTEDEPGDTLKPRLMAAGADLRRVFMFQMGTKDELVPFRVPQDADELARRVTDTDAALVVIDPLVEFMDGKVDSYKSHQVRQALAAVRQIVHGRDCAVLAVFHLNKGVSTDPLARTEGSAAFTQVVRGGLMVGHDPDDPDGEAGNQRVVAVSSTNLAALAPSLVYRIETAVVTGDTGESITTARMVHIGESSVGAHDLLRGAPDAEEQTAADEAKNFLRVELAEGPRPAGEVENEARRIGISKTTLWRARSGLGIVPAKDSFGGPWMWALPPEDSTFNGRGTFGSTDTPNPASGLGFSEDSAHEDSTPSGGGLESSQEADLEPIWKTAPTTPPDGSP